MFRNLAKTLAQMPHLLRARGVKFSLLFALLLFIALFIGVMTGFRAEELQITESESWITGIWSLLLPLLEASLLLFVTWVLFPPVVSFLIGFFLDPVADAVEERHYSQESKGKPPGFMATLLPGLGLLGMMLFLNLLLIPFFLFPPLYFVLYWGINGYLLGREYFEMAGMRYAPAEEVKRWRRYDRGRVFIHGVLIAIAFTIPLLNLFAPIFAMALMVHLAQSIRRAE